MKEWSAWSRQAGSDYSAAERTLKRGDPDTYCHAIAKYQQSVEKYLKAMVALLLDSGLLDSRPRDIGHTLDKTIKVLELRKTTNIARESGLSGYLEIVLSGHFTSEAKAISLLAPSYPEPGRPFARNTEYPFNNSDGTWTSPCVSDVFTLKDVERYHKVAGHFDLTVPRFLKQASILMGLTL